MSVAQIAAGRSPRAVTQAARRYWMFRAALGIFGIVAALAVLGPWIAPYDPTELYVGDVNGVASLARRWRSTPRSRIAWDSITCSGNSRN